MKRRTSGILAILALVSSGLTALGTAVAPSASAVTPDDPIPLCSAHPAAPCLVSLTHDGAPVTSAYRLAWNDSGAGFYNWRVEATIGPDLWTAAMGASEMGQTFAMKLDFGAFNPATVGGLAQPVGSNPVQWKTVGSHHYVTVTASPIHRVLGCSGDPATCPPAATPDNDTVGYLSLVVNDGRWFGENAAEHAKIAGFYNLRNTDIGSDPPVITTNAITGDRTMIFTLQNTHEDSDHVLFHGFAHLRLPNRMLREVYDIPDPDTMTSTSLAAALSSGSGTITVHPDASHTAMLIDITGLTFSKRTANVRLGVIVPTRPATIAAKRLNRTTVKVDFSGAKARGSRVTGYLTRCVNHRSVKNVRTKYSLATVKHLKPGKHYTCRARAISKAGYGTLERVDEGLRPRLDGPEAAAWQRDQSADGAEDAEDADHQ